MSQNLPHAKHYVLFIANSEMSLCIMLYIHIFILNLIINVLAKMVIESILYFNIMR